MPQDPKDSRYQETGFPTLQWEDDSLDTRPQPFYEKPWEYQVESQMAIIESFHPRIAKSIHAFWGHKDCVEYLQTLILNGGYSEAHVTQRVGFKTEVLSALINLAGLHKLGSKLNK